MPLNFRVHMLDRFPFVRVVWISMLERPKLDLAIRPDSRVDVMHIPGTPSTWNPKPLN